MKQKEYIPTFGEQVSKWQREEMITSLQQKELTRLKGKIGLWTEV